MSVKIIAAAVRQWAAVEDGGLNPMQVRELLKALDAEPEPLELRGDAEREAVRVALATCFYHASDEARALREEFAKLPEEDRPAAESIIQLTELRRARYSELHDRLLADASPSEKAAARL